VVTEEELELVLRLRRERGVPEAGRAGNFVATRQPERREDESPGVWGGALAYVLSE
jgi:hypothetical protein